MNEIAKDKSNYTFEQRIVVSVWEHEQPEMGKAMKQAWEIFQQRFVHETLQRRHYCNLSINVLQ